jgi:hypothetical protein
LLNAIPLSLFYYGFIKYFLLDEKIIKMLI